MLKFWKKKPIEAGPAKTVAEPAAAKAVVDAVIPESGDPSLHEALTEIPAPAEAQADTERFAAPAIESAPAAETSATTKRSWRERLSGNTFARGLSSLFVRHPKLDDDLLDELETTLISADVGVEASSELVEGLRKRMHKREFADAPALLAALRQSLVGLLKPVEQPLDVRGQRPFVVLVVGINGAGKTTTIGKLARRWRDEKHAVMLAAGDTFAPPRSSNSEPGASATRCR